MNKLNPGQFKDNEGLMTEESPMYVYATELVGDYYSLVDLKSKKVLTVTGSGDQVINAISYGAGSVTGFDVNKRAAFISELKISGILNLNYNEFLSFFGKKHGSANFNSELYKKLANNLSDESRSFFDRLIDVLNGEDIFTSKYFRQRSFFDIEASKINEYLKDEESYKKTKDLLGDRSISYLTSDLSSLSKKLSKETFDLINISNIPNYFTGDRGAGGSIEDMLDIFQELHSLLNDGGSIMYYSYSPSIYPIEPPEASQEETIQKIKDLNIFEVKPYFIESISKEGEDRVLFLSKI